MRVESVSVDSVIVYFEQIVSEDILNMVQNSYYRLKELDGIVELTPSYCSILVRYDIGVYSHIEIKNKIVETLKNKTTKSIIKKPKTVKIPTRYNGIDLDRVANYNNLTIEDVIKLHTQKIYRVYAIGFMVGFAYLAKVDTKIAAPRLSTPRTKVPKGSVAIADNQTAIYPKESAGGWNIIGETLFDRFEEFNIGDFVQFERI